MKEDLFLEIHVLCDEPYRVSGKDMEIVMIPFTGTVDGDLFRGKTVGTGVDTQKIEKDDSIMLSARYMLEGTDCAGNACRVFVENQGNWTVGFTPNIVTDSPVLARWETARLYATADGIPEGVLIRIFSGE